MKKFTFLVMCAILFCAQATAQITTFNQRGKATQEMTDSGLKIAHPSLPNNAQVKVTNTANGKEVIATVTDRIPASRDRIADLSREVWQALDLNPNTEIQLSISPPPRQRTPEPTPTPSTSSAVADSTKTQSPSTTQPQTQSTKPATEPTTTQSKPTTSAQETKPASNDDYLAWLRDMVMESLYLSLLRDVNREYHETSQSVTSPSTSVITVYPPYPPYPPIPQQSVVTNQPIVTNQPVTNLDPVDQPLVTSPVPTITTYPQPQTTNTPPAPQSNSGSNSQATSQLNMELDIQAVPPAGVPQQNQGVTSQAAPQTNSRQTPQATQPASTPQPNQRSTSQTAQQSNARPSTQVTPQPNPRPTPQAASQTSRDCYANPAPQPTTLQIIPRLPNPNSNEIYRLQVGSFCDPSSANALEDKLKAAGFKVDRELYGKMHRVIVTDIPASLVQYAVQKLEVLGIKQIWVRQ